MENFSDRIEWLFEGTSNEIYGSFEAHSFCQNLNDHRNDLAALLNGPRYSYIFLLIVLVIIDIGFAWT